MLYALSITSFVLIDRLHLEAASGFTALTGETGAGKSIILDAISLVLGGAADRKQADASEVPPHARPGCTRDGPGEMPEEAGLRP